mmetsp:Transcript_6098/g.21595  ORF Transcript_6098/g.21595 Transcript_6098/m.21595 type:complete len:165 (+) Transcript_6098:253-747(+)
MVLIRYGCWEEVSTAWREMMEGSTHLGRFEQLHPHGSKHRGFYELHKLIQLDEDGDGLFPRKVSHPIPHLHNQLVRLLVLASQQAESKSACRYVHPGWKEGSKEIQLSFSAGRQGPTLLVLDAEILLREQFGLRTDEFVPEGRELGYLEDVSEVSSQGSSTCTH